MILTALRTRLILTVLFLPLLAFVVFLAAKGLSAAMERTVTYRYFDEALSHSPEAPSSVVWRQNAGLDRRLTAADEAEAGRALSEAWALHAAALATGDVRFLPDRFSGPALERSRHAVAASVAGPAIRMVVLHQEATPVFHHLDGSLMEVATSALAVRFALDAQGGLADLRISTDATISVLTNESSGWHIFAHELRATTPIAPAAARPALRLPRVAGVNYYPASHPWTRFWPEYDPAETALDFDRIVRLSGNSVRIFLPRTEFLDPARQAVNLASLANLLDLAAARGLRVLPVLFDLHSDYAPNLWADDDAMLRAVLPVLAASPAVVLVDLKNEADLDYAAQGKGTVQAWLNAMAADARLIAPGLALTVGFSNAQAAGEMVDLVDVVTYHDYAPLSEARQSLSDLKVRARGKQVMVTEFGDSSWSLLAGLPSSDAKQAQSLAARLAALSEADGLLVWTLHDYPKPDRAAVGMSPWNARLQAHFGLLDAASREKPAATEVQHAFQTYLKDPSQ